MPYRWTTAADGSSQALELWPHQSLSPRGLTLFVGATFAMILIPALALLGTVLLWGVLPFLLLAVWGIYFALQKNHQALQILEVLHLAEDDARLVRTNPGGTQQDWRCNRYWTQVLKYEDKGPVPHYVTLRGEGREVEIGAFLSEEERLSLYDELCRVFQNRAG